MFAKECNPADYTYSGPASLFVWVLECVIWLFLTDGLKFAVIRNHLMSIDHAVRGW
jgi:hypothetical protein